jgi:hypothetical protein
MDDPRAVIVHSEDILFMAPLQHPVTLRMGSST